MKYISRRGLLLGIALIVGVVGCERVVEEERPWVAPLSKPNPVADFMKGIDLKVPVSNEPSALRAPILVYEPTRGGLWESDEFAMYAMPADTLVREEVLPSESDVWKYVKPRLSSL